MKNIKILVYFFFIYINIFNLKAMQSIENQTTPPNTQKLQFSTDFIGHEKTAIYVHTADFDKIKGYELIKPEKTFDFSVLTALMYAIPSAYIDVLQESTMHKLILSRNSILLNNNDIILNITVTFIAIFDFSEVKGAQNGMIRFLVTRNEKFTVPFVETHDCIDRLIRQTSN